MDKYARLDGFVVHPLDLFPKTHEVEDYKSKIEANLDGFNVHPIDSFINHKNDPLKYLTNQTPTNNDFSDILNNINTSPTYQDYKINEYDQYSSTLYKPYSPIQNYTNTDFSTNTTLDTNYNFGSESTYNYNTSSNNGILYSNYPTTTSTYNIRTIKHDYFNDNSYNNNIITYKNKPSYITTNYGGNYTSTYNAIPTYTSISNINYDIFPSSKNINNEIKYNKYITSSNNITYEKPYIYDILNNTSSTNLYSPKTIPEYTQSYNYNIYPTSTLTRINTVKSKPISTYAFPIYSKGISLGTFPYYKDLSSVKSSPDIFQKSYTPIEISSGTSSIDTGNLYQIRSLTVPRKYTKIRPPIVLPTKKIKIDQKPKKSQPIIIPLSNHRKIKRTLTPITINSFITPYESNGNEFVTQSIIGPTLPTIITQTSKPLTTYHKITIKKLPPKYINVTGTNIF